MSLLIRPNKTFFVGIPSAPLPIDFPAPLGFSLANYKRTYKIPLPRKDAASIPPLMHLPLEDKFLSKNTLCRTPLSSGRWSCSHLISTVPPALDDVIPLIFPSLKHLFLPLSYSTPGLHGKFPPPMELNLPQSQNNPPTPLSPPLSHVNAALYTANKLKQLTRRFVRL